MPNDKGPEDAIDARLVRRLATILNDTGLTEIEVERGELRIRVARQLTVAAPTQVAVAAPVYSAPAQSAAQHAPAAAPASPESPAAMEAAGEQIKSPMVGTVYLQQQPGTPAFVQVGDLVEEGQTLLIIEAMKTMNPIPAPRAGKIIAILVDDSQPVEFGEPLAVIE